MRSKNRLKEMAVGVAMGVLFSAAVVLAGGLKPGEGPTTAGSQGKSSIYLPIVLNLGGSSSLRFMNNLNGTVTDNLTGLIWLMNANCANATRDWATALSDVVALNTNGTMNGTNCSDISNGGSHQIDWRLPKVTELVSLIDVAYHDPALSNAAGTAKWTTGDAFTGVQSSWYWSSTTVADLPDIAWYVNLYDGYRYLDDKTNTNYVWPVRGGQ